MNINEFCRKAVGTPFVPRGRDWEGWDCWGLICIAYKELFDIELPQYNGQYHSVKERDLISKLYKDGATADWQEVEEVQMGDVVLIYMCGRACHVGMAIDKERMFHVEHGINTCVQSIKDFRVEGVYRYGK